MVLVVEVSTMDITPRNRAEVLDELRKLGEAIYVPEKERIHVRYEVDDKDVEALWTFVEDYSDVYRLMTQDYFLDFPERPDREAEE